MKRGCRARRLELGADAFQYYLYSIVHGPRTCFIVFVSDAYRYRFELAPYSALPRDWMSC